MSHSAGRQAQRSGAPGSSKAEKERARERAGKPTIKRKPKKSILEQITSAVGRVAGAVASPALTVAQGIVAARKTRTFTGEGEVFGKPFDPDAGARGRSGRGSREDIFRRRGTGGIIPFVTSIASTEAKKKRKKIGIGSTLLTSSLGDVGAANIQTKTLLGG